MKRIVIFMLLLALPVIAGTYDLKKVIIGKWAVVEYGVNQDKGTLVFDGKNLIEIFEGKMTSHKYYIINNQLCASTDKKDCVEAVFVSKDEIIFPQGKTHMKRIKE